MTDIILSAEPAPYVTALVCLSGRIIVQAVDRLLMPRTCVDWVAVTEHVREKHPLPCLVVVQETLGTVPVRHVLIS